MLFSMRRSFVFLLLAGSSLIFAATAQEPVATPAAAPAATTDKPGAEAQIPDAPTPQKQNPQAKPDDAQSGAKPRPEPKRILGVMPNYRAVSADTIPPPPTPKEAFKIATENTFDYSAFVFVGVTSLLAEGTETHEEFGQGVAGFGRYYWRGFLDKAAGNYMVDFAFPTILHEDERYYAMGKGGIVKRSVYAGTRVFITPNYKGHNTFNAAEIFGRGVSQAISLTYYPSSTQTVGGFTSKYAYAVGRDALTNVFRELWPDISYHVLHRHHQGASN